MRALSSTACKGKSTSAQAELTCVSCPTLVHVVAELVKHLADLLNAPCKQCAPEASPRVSARLGIAMVPKAVVRLEVVMARSLGPHLDGLYVGLHEVLKCVRDRHLRLAHEQLPVRLELHQEGTLHPHTTQSRFSAVSSNTKTERRVMETRGHETGKHTISRGDHRMGPFVPIQKGNGTHVLEQRRYLADRQLHDRGRTSTASRLKAARA